MRAYASPGEVAAAAVRARRPIGPIHANLRVTAAVLTAEFRARVRKVAWLSSTTDDIRAIQSYLRERGVSY